MKTPPKSRKPATPASPTNNRAIPVPTDKPVERAGSVSVWVDANLDPKGRGDGKGGPIGWYDHDHMEEGRGRFSVVVAQLSHSASFGELVLARARQVGLPLDREARVSALYCSYVASEPGQKPYGWFLGSFPYEKAPQLPTRPLTDVEIAIQRSGGLPKGVAPESIDALLVKSLRIERARRGLEGLERFTSVRGLSLKWCDLPSYEPIAALEALESLEIEYCDLASLDRVLPASVRTLHLRCNRLVSLEPLRNLRALASVNVSGNPLDEASLALLDELRARGVTVSCDHDAIRQLNRTLAAQAPGFVCAGSPERCLLTWTGVDAEIRKVYTSLERITAALASGTLDLKKLK